MSMEAEDMVEEMVPYLGKDQIDIVLSLCGGALDATQLAARVRRRRFTSLFKALPLVCRLPLLSISIKSYLFKF